MTKFWVTLLSFAICSAAARSQIPVGFEFQVNSNSKAYGSRPAIAVAPSGEFVVVWVSLVSSGSDSFNYSIQGRRFSSSGTPSGDDFQVNSFTTGAKGSPAVAIEPSDNFVVVWDSEGSSAGDTSSYSVQGRLFSSDGTSIGDDFQINNYTSGAQGQTSVALSSAGEFVVVWSSVESSGPDYFYSIRGQRFSSVGVALGGEFQINSHTTSIQYLPSVAADDTGQFVIVWASDGSNANDNSGFSIQGRRFFSDGAPATEEFQVNVFTTGTQYHPTVAADPEGNFVIVWSSSGSSDTDLFSYSIQGRRFSSTGDPSSDEFQVNTYTRGDQYQPAVAMDPGGAFVVVWASLGSGGSDSSDYSVQGRSFTSSGTPLGNEFQINTYTTNSQYLPVAAKGPEGDFVVAWARAGSTSPGSSSYSIQGQRFDIQSPDLVFADGFESGNLSAWSLAVPRSSRLVSGAGDLACVATSQQNRELWYEAADLGVVPEDGCQGPCEGTDKHAVFLDGVCRSLTERQKQAAKNEACAGVNNVDARVLANRECLQRDETGSCLCTGGEFTEAVAKCRDVNLARKDKCKCVCRLGYQNGTCSTVQIAED